MKAIVFVEKIGKKKYRASTSQPVHLESEGASQDQAVERLCELAKKRLAAGTFMQMSLPDVPSNPWRTFAGIWKDHPEFDAFLQNIARHRRAADEADPAQ
jgi:hypothetical protein